MPGIRWDKGSITTWTWGTGGRLPFTIIRPDVSDPICLLNDKITLNKAHILVSQRSSKYSSPIKRNSEFGSDYMDDDLRVASPILALRSTSGKLLNEHALVHEVPVPFTEMQLTMPRTPEARRWIPESRITRKIPSTRTPSSTAFTGGKRLLPDLFGGSERRFFPVLLCYFFLLMSSLGWEEWDLPL